MESSRSNDPSELEISLNEPTDEESGLGTHVVLSTDEGDEPDASRTAARFLKTCSCKREVKGRGDCELGKRRAEKSGRNERTALRRRFRRRSSERGCERQGCELVRLA